MTSQIFLDEIARTKRIDEMKIRVFPVHEYLINLIIYSTIGSYFQYFISIILNRIESS